MKPNPTEVKMVAALTEAEKELEAKREAFADKRIKELMEPLVLALLARITDARGARVSISVEFIDREAQP